MAIDWDLKFCTVASRSLNIAMTFPFWFCFMFEFTFILIMSKLIAFHPFSAPVSCTVLEFSVVIYQTKREWRLWNACLLMSSTRCVPYVNRIFMSCFKSRTLFPEYFFRLSKSRVYSSLFCFGCFYRQNRTEFLCLVLSGVVLQMRWIACLCVSLCVSHCVTFLSRPSHIPKHPALIFCWLCCQNMCLSI